MSVTGVSFAPPDLFPSSRQPWPLERLLEEHSIALGMAPDRSTTYAYSSALNSYLAFCNAHHFDPEPTVDTFSFYITYMSHYIDPRSVRTYLSEIVNELEPFYPAAREIRQSPIVARTLEGCLRRFSSPIKQKQPLTREHLRHVMNHMPSPISYDDLLFRALLETGFFGLNRLGELVWPDKVEDQDSSKLSWRHTIVVLPDCYQFLLPRDNPDTRLEGSKVVKSDSQPDPFDTFTRYLAARDLRFPLRPQLWLRADGSVPVRSWFIHVLRSYLPASVAGHSMRAGGATSLAAAGVSPSQVQAIGRWKSAAFERYI